MLTPSQPLPPPTSIPSSLNASLTPVLQIAQSVVANRSISNNWITGPQALINDLAAGDSASVGMCVLLANWTGRGKVDGLDYGGAALDQLNFLYSAAVPKTYDGAISHRTDQLQLWSDSVYMVPPFLAYYGALVGDANLLENAYRQIWLYRSYLLDTSASANGLWQHVVLGAGDDDYGHWSTGNGWAAAGMLRVLGTIQNSAFADLMASEQSDLIFWVDEVLGGMYGNLDDTSIFKNYPDQPLATADQAAGIVGNFYDVAGTTLVASAAYRLSLLGDIHTYIPQAEASRIALFSNASNGTLAHFTSEGWPTPVVNPDDYAFELDIDAAPGGVGSPESVAFVLELQAAWADWQAAGSKGAPSTTSSGSGTAPTSTTSSARRMNTMTPSVVRWVGVVTWAGWWMFGP